MFGGIMSGYRYNIVVVIVVQMQSPQPAFQQPQQQGAVFNVGGQQLQQPGYYYPTDVGPVSNVVPNYHSPTSIALGITLIVAGVLSAIFNAVELGFSIDSGYYCSIGFIGHGFWCGAMVLILPNPLQVLKTRSLPQR